MPPPPAGQPYGSGQPYGAQPPGQQWGAPPPAPGYPPPGYQPPAPGYRQPGAGFDPKTVNPLDWGILAAGLLAFIFSFVSYYSLKPKAALCSVGGCGSVTTSAWHGFFGWFAMLLALIGSAAVAISLFAPHVKLPAPARLIGLGAYALATLCVILAIFIVPRTYNGVSLPSSLVDTGHGFGFWISLIVIVGGLVLSLMRFQQTGGQLPGALAKMPNIGGHRSGGPPPPPPGYGPPTPPPPPGYGPPTP
ncbi:MAG: hypothetical protein JWO57_920 [Pseudonocardiales bacterium]|nr:hypothetical protein [Pseudonocardiales bacterium]